MTTLVAALQLLGITAEVELDGRWAAIQGARGTAYVIDAGWGESFYVWCDIPEERAVERYRDPLEAIQAGLHRAGGSPQQSQGNPPIASS